VNNIGPPPFVFHDVALPVLLGEDKVPLLRPYVVADPCGRLVELTEDDYPYNIIVLETARGAYLHLDPRCCFEKLKSLIRAGDIPSKEWEMWIYSKIGEVEHDGGYWLLFPGTPDRFYFHRTWEAVDAKRDQIAYPKFAMAEWFCPATDSFVGWFGKSQKVEPGMDVAAMLRAR
jgi:hypothetical protein